MAEAFAIVQMKGGNPNIGNLPHQSYVLVGHLPDYSWGIYRFTGAAVQLAAINALPHVYRICTMAEYDTTISAARRTRINEWLAARGWPRVAEWWTYRQALRAAVRRLGDTGWAEDRVGAGDDVPAVKDRLAGVNFTDWMGPSYGSGGAEASLASLAAHNANAVAIVVRGYQQTAKSVEVFAGASTPALADVAHAVAQAKALGLRPLLKLHVHMLDGTSAWAIGGFETEELWDQWFASYLAWSMPYLNLAADSGVHTVCIGTEYRDTSGQTARWRQLIAAVRARFGGALTYAAYWGDEAEVQWWDALDYIGIDAYYPLTDHASPTLGELAAVWETHRSALRALAVQWQRPVLFTEIGYRNQAGTNVAPADWKLKGDIDQTEQAACYEAVYRAFWNQPWFKGIWWWDWSTDLGRSAEDVASYMPANRAAGAVMGAWHGAEVSDA